MRFLIFFAAFLGATSAAMMDLERGHTGDGGLMTFYGEKKMDVDKLFLVRQKNIFKLLNHVNMPNANKEQVMIGKDFDILSNKDKFLKLDVVMEFMEMRKTGMLPKGKIFCIMYEKQRMQAIALVKLMYFAKDFDTFYRLSCWAREHINEGMFVYALTVAILHRDDCKGLMLPAPYEINPQFFLNTEVIQKGYKLKMQERIMDPKLAKFYGVTMKDNTFIVNSNYSGWYLHVNDEQKMTYFTEDIGLNSFYYYLHVIFPFWMDTVEFKMDNMRHGEFFFYMHQQILARYYLERLSNDLGEIPRFSWTKPIKTGFTPSLKYDNGLEFPSRPNWFDLQTEDNLYDLIDVEDVERRIKDAIDQGFVITEDGTKLSLQNPLDIELLGRMMLPNNENPNRHFYMHLIMISKMLLGNSADPITDYFTAPSALEHFQTCLRDPMFYQMFQRLMRHYFNLKGMFPAYKRETLDFEGVRIEDFKVDKLVTYFDDMMVDMTNAMFRKGEEVDQGKDRFTFMARQMRLNHKPFDVKIDVMSDKTTDALVKIFIGPKYDSMGREMDMEKNRINFVMLDKFLVDLKTGKNVIVRKSRDFTIYDEDRVMTKDMMKALDTWINKGEHMTIDLNRRMMKMPLRLALPKGKMGGMPFQMYIFITKRGMDNTIVMNQNKMMDVGNAFGFPLDRTIEVEEEFFTKNMMIKDILIHHMDDRMMFMDNRMTLDDKMMLGDKMMYDDKMMMRHEDMTL